MYMYMYMYVSVCVCVHVHVTLYNVIAAHVVYKGTCVYEARLVVSE